MNRRQTDKTFCAAVPLLTISTVHTRALGTFIIHTVGNRASVCYDRPIYVTTLWVLTSPSAELFSYWLDFFHSSSISQLEFDSNVVSSQRDARRQYWCPSACVNFLQNIRKFCMRYQYLSSPVTVLPCIELTWRMTDYYPTILGSASAGLIARVICHPMDTIKSRLQAGQSAFRSLEGIGALYRGIGAVICGGVPGVCIYMTSYEVSIRQPESRSGNALFRSTNQLLEQPLTYVLHSWLL